MKAKPEKKKIVLVECPVCDKEQPPQSGSWNCRECHAPFHDKEVTIHETAIQHFREQRSNGIMKVKL